MVNLGSFVLTNNSGTVRYCIVFRRRAGVLCVSRRARARVAVCRHVASQGREVRQHNTTQTGRAQFVSAPQTSHKTLGGTDNNVDSISHTCVYLKPTAINNSNNDPNTSHSYCMDILFNFKIY